MIRDAKRFARLPALAVVLLAAMLVPMAAHGEPGLLDGKTFATREGDVGKTETFDNVITFSQGKFHSLACDQWGYGKADVKATRDGDVIRFEVETHSEKYGTRQVWKGTLTGDTLEGTRVMYPKATFFRPNPQPVEGWFKGALRRG